MLSWGPWIESPIIKFLIVFLVPANKMGVLIKKCFVHWWGRVLHQLARFTSITCSTVPLYAFIFHCFCHSFRKFDKIFRENIFVISSNTPYSLDNDVPDQTMKYFNPIYLFYFFFSRTDVVVVVVIVTMTKKNYNSDSSECKKVDERHHVWRQQHQLTLLLHFDHIPLAQRNQMKWKTSTK